MLLGSYLGLSAQAEELQVLGTWDDNTLPATVNQNQYNDVWGYVAPDGTEYALMGSRTFVHVFRILPNGTPTEIGRIAGTQNVTWRDIKTYQNYAYAVCDGCSEGMLVLDLSNLPNSVSLVRRTTSFFTKSHNIYIDESVGRLYAVGTNTQASGVVVLDLSTDPSNPTLLAQTDLPGGYLHDIHVVNNIGYGSSGYDGLFVYDLSNPAAPVTLGSLTAYPQQGYNHSSWLDPSRGVLVFADENFDRSVKMVDVNDPMDITVTDLFRSALLGGTNTNSIAHNPFIRGPYAIISYYHDGVQIFDISDATNAVQVAGYDTEPTNTEYSGSEGAWGVYPFLPSQRLLASDVNNGLFVLKSATLDLGPADGNAALPVEFLQVDARSRGAHHLLSWTTSFEQNVDRFVVEYSTGAEAFRPLGMAKATGDSERPTDYRFLHENPAEGQYYYRIRSIDLDGSYEFSRTVQLEKKSAGTISVFPNPSTGSIYLDLPEASASSILLIDIRGKVLQRFATDQRRLDLAAYPTGVYFLQITTATESRTLRVLKR